jgi:hypothetical protein
MAYNPAASITTLLGLTDTPSSFSGEGLKSARVNTGETALEFHSRYKDTPIAIAVGDETTVIVTGTSEVTFRMPAAFTLTEVRASLSTAASAGTFTVDINESGSTILSTKLTIDATEKTSETAAIAAVISDSALADDAEITIDIDDAGSASDAAGLKVYLIGTWD